MIVFVLQAILLLFIMIYCHIIDDYLLQGILAKLKQRNYWYGAAGPNADNYRHDYIVALICHAISWSISISIPAIFLYYKTSNIKLLVTILIAICINTIIHAIIDNLKANELKINLVIDQSIHLAQVITYWVAIIMTFIL